MAVIRQQDAKSYKFKSSGVQLSEQQQIQSTPKVGRQIGIKTPVQFDDLGPEFISIHTSIKDAIHDNLINLILTNHGERLGLPDFGANLMELAFELQSEAGQTEAIKRINKAIAKYMPYVVPQKFQPVVDHFANKEVAKVGVRLSYDVPRLGVQNKGVEVIIFAVG